MFKQKGEEDCTWPDTLGASQTAVALSALEPVAVCAGLENDNRPKPYSLFFCTLLIQVLLPAPQRLALVPWAEHWTYMLSIIIWHVPIGHMFQGLAYM